MTWTLIKANPSQDRYSCEAAIHHAVQNLGAYNEPPGSGKPDEKISHQPGCASKIPPKLKAIDGE